MEKTLDVGNGATMPFHSEKRPADKPRSLKLALFIALAALTAIILSGACTSVSAQEIKWQNWGTEGVLTSHTGPDGKTTTDYEIRNVESWKTNKQLDHEFRMRQEDRKENIGIANANAKAAKYSQPKIITGRGPLDCLRYGAGCEPIYDDYYVPSNGTYFSNGGVNTSWEGNVAPYAVTAPSVPPVNSNRPVPPPAYNGGPASSTSYGATAPAAHPQTFFQFTPPPVNTGPATSRSYQGR